MTKSLSVEQYTFYKTQAPPLSDTAIMKIHGLHNAALNKWKHENDLIGKTFEPSVKVSDVKTTEGYSPNAKVKEKLQETPKTADSSDIKPKQELSHSEETEQCVTVPVDDKKDVEIMELQKRVEIYRAERNEARDIIHHLNQKCQDFQNIIEDQADEIEGLKAEIADLRSQPNHAQLKGDMLTNLMKLYLQEVEG